LIFDTETTADAVQRLLFGCYRHCRWTLAGTLEPIQEGLFYADDLPEFDPVGYQTLRRYAETQGLPLLSRATFSWRVFHKIAYKAQGLVVGFNLSFDLTRIAERWGEARGKQYGGFSLTLFSTRDNVTGEVRESRWLPRIWLQILTSKFSFIKFATPFELDPGEGEIETGADGKRYRRAFRGRFLDLKTLVFALTSKGHSLASAGRLYKIEHPKIDAPGHGLITPEYIAYNRRDVLATAELLEKARAHFDSHPICLDPCKAFSPAAIAKAYLRSMGVTPPNQKFTSLSKELNGIAMSAYYGGRAEARIRLTPVPVIHTDFVSMYPTVNALMGLWQFVIAETLSEEDFTDGARKILESATPEEYFQPDKWKHLHWFALVKPDGDILPVRAAYDESSPRQTNIGVNHFTSELPVWYSGPDLIAAKLLGNKTPRIIRAVRLIPHGVQAGLKPVALTEKMTIDPGKDDFFRVIIEQRKRLQRDKSDPGNIVAAQALKILANSGSYGISAECTPEELKKGAKVTVMVYGGFTGFERKTRSPETPGEFSLPPFAALITGAARLMLALLERTVADAGGTYGFCDTDSMAIVATEVGGPITPRDPSDTLLAINALSASVVQDIVERFSALNPYAKDAIPGSILEIKSVSLGKNKKIDPVQLLAISAKRYTFYRLSPSGDVEIIEPSEHGLGHLLNPCCVGTRGTRDDDEDNEDKAKPWITEVWETIVRRTLGLPVTRLSFADLPAVTRTSITTPHVMRGLSGKDWGDSLDGEIRPATFLLSVAVARLGHSVGADPTRFHLISPFTSDPSKWLDGPWVDVHSGREFRVTTDIEDLDPECVRVKTFADVVEEFAVHAEPKSAGGDGHACVRTTRGLLQRRHIRAGQIVLVGKESNRLEEVRKGLVHDWDEIVTEFDDPADDWWEKVFRPKIIGVRTADIATATGLGERAARNLRAGRSRPTPQLLARIRVVLVKRVE